jgi:hypothetical protein
MTKPGRTLLDTLTPLVARQVKRALAGLSDNALRDLVKTLKHIGQNLEKSYLE